MKFNLDTLPWYARRTEDGCLIWGQSVNSTGYPQCWVNGRQSMVKRVVWVDLLKRPPPTRRQVLSTSCRDRRCVEPTHIVLRSRGAVLREAHTLGARVMSPAEYRHRLEAAQRTGMARLTWDQVHEIRAYPPSVPHARIAPSFGVSANQISKIRRGKSWREELQPATVFSFAQSAPSINGRGW